MTEQTHTPGPWCIVSDIHDGRIGIGSNTAVIVIALPLHGMRNGVQGMANARLIAAAPDLLDVVRSFLEFHNEGRIPDGLTLAAAEAAVSKATER